MTNDPSLIHAIGEYAAELLLSDIEGVFLVTFSTVTYRRHASNEVIWLVKEDAPTHRRAIQCAGFLPETSVNTPYIVKNKVLVLESACSLDLDRAMRWKTHRQSRRVENTWTYFYHLVRTFPRLLDWEYSSKKS